MPNNPGLSDLSPNALLKAFADPCSGGVLSIYDGSQSVNVTSRQTGKC
jgi:hypothetical protein